MIAATNSEDVGVIREACSDISVLQKKLWKAQPWLYQTWL